MISGLYASLYFPEEPKDIITFREKMKEATEYYGCVIGEENLRIKGDAVDRITRLDKNRCMARGVMCVIFEQYTNTRLRSRLFGTLVL